ncbi:MAG: hypothetical protein D6766_01005 [Verrucomicrobia bacterium]|nr:MAG: hypothetical protein D6766_01005 [Verrucomicrobiota bacterium]
MSRPKGAGRLLVPGLRSQPCPCFLLADPDRHPLATRLTEAGLEIELPAQVSDPVCSVITLNVPGELQVQNR